MTVVSIYVYRRMAVNNSSWIVKWLVNTTNTKRYKRLGWINSLFVIGVDVFWPFTMVNPQMSALWEIYPFLPVIIHYSSSWNLSMNALNLLSFVPAQETIVIIQCGTEIGSNWWNVLQHLLNRKILVADRNTGLGGPTGVSRPNQNL